MPRRSELRNRRCRRSAPDFRRAGDARPTARRKCEIGDDLLVGRKAACTPARSWRARATAGCRRDGFIAEPAPVDLIFADRLRLVPGQISINSHRCCCCSAGRILALGLFSMSSAISRIWAALQRLLVRGDRLRGDSRRPEALADSTAALVSVNNSHARGRCGRSIGTSHICRRGPQGESSSGHNQKGESSRSVALKWRKMKSRMSTYSATVCSL